MVTVEVVTTGGTIASTRDPVTGAAVAAVAPEELLASVPGLAAVADVRAHVQALRNSADVTPRSIAELARVLAARAGADDAPDGFVVTHGTDTLEETVFALAGLLAIPQPVVVTAAMRSADAERPDGPGNLLDAVRVAATRSLPGEVVTVLAGQLHGAREVTKTHTTAVDAFTSPGAGPIGTVDGDGVRLDRRPRPVPAFPLVDPDVEVDLVRMVVGLGPRALRHALADGVAAVVVEGSGAGNVHDEAVPAIRDLLAADVPVILASRCLAGRVVPAYGGAGGGATLAAEGVVLAGELSGPKARLAVCFLRAAGATTGEVRRWFQDADDRAAAPTV
jgi:L-asparaginase